MSRDEPSDDPPRMLKSRVHWWPTLPHSLWCWTVGMPTGCLLLAIAMLTVAASFASWMTGLAMAKALAK